MAKYDVTVDTRDMANKIDTVSNKVSGVTTAVVAMEAAVFAAERDATNKLCKRLNKGFFSLVTSQIEQKNATALSSVNAYASELIQQQEALLDLKKRMGDDFVILTERYSKLFRGLDVALHNRVHELDKPVIRFCDWDVADVPPEAFSPLVTALCAHPASIDTVNASAINDFNTFLFIVNSFTVNRLFL